MPLPKPKAALLFNNYFDNDSLSLLKQPLDIELILAGAYYNFVKGEGKQLTLDKKVPFSERFDKLSYETTFQIPDNGGHIPVEIYNSNFNEIFVNNINVADLFNEFKNTSNKATSSKTSEGQQNTTFFISRDLYAALDAIFSVGGTRLAVPFIAGEDVFANIQPEQKTDQGVPVAEIGNLPAGAGQSDSSMTGGLESVQGTNIGQIFNDSTGVGAGAPGYNPMSDPGGTQQPSTPPELPGQGSNS